MQVRKLIRVLPKKQTKKRKRAPQSVSKTKTSSKKAKTKKNKTGRGVGLRRAVTNKSLSQIIDKEEANESDHESQDEHSQQQKTLHVKSQVIEFDEDARVTILQPWTYLDGELNVEFLSMLKRKIVKLIKLHPGILEAKLFTLLANIFRISVFREVIHNLEVSGAIYSRIIVYTPPSLFSDPDEPPLVFKVDPTDATTEETISSLQKKYGSVDRCYFPSITNLVDLEKTLPSSGKDWTL